jgi:RNA-directed DNA polymerase
VYCKDENRRATYGNEPFDFLGGYTFGPRPAVGRGKQFTNFLPAVSGDALTEIGRKLRGSRINRRSVCRDKTLDDLAQMVNTVVQGWINSYCRFYSTRLYRYSSASTRTWCAGPRGNSNASRETFGANLQVGVLRSSVQRSG